MFIHPAENIAVPGSFDSQRPPGIILLDEFDIMIVPGQKDCSVPLALAGRNPNTEGKIDFERIASFRVRIGLIALDLSPGLER